MTKQLNKKNGVLIWNYHDLLVCLRTIAEKGYILTYGNTKLIEDLSTNKEFNIYLEGLKNGR